MEEKPGCKEEVLVQREKRKKSASVDFTKSRRYFAQASGWVDAQWAASFAQFCASFVHPLSQMNGIAYHPAARRFIWLYQILDLFAALRYSRRLGQQTQ